jgi:hypothetical protein
MARLLFIALASVASVALAGCSGKKQVGFDDDGGGDDGGSNCDPNDPFCDPTVQDGGAGDGNSKSYKCTGDLRTIVDENGNVIMQCPDDQGCAGGQCIPACDAAAASKGSIGCDYQVATPSFYQGIKPPCFAVFLANNWPKDVQVKVSRAGMNYNVSSFGRIAVAGTPATSWAPVPAGGIPPGKVAVLFMSHDPASVNGGPLTCPIAPALSQTFGSALPNSGSMPNITGRGQAWHITSTYPVTGYDILPYGGATSYLPSAELLFPTTAWGTNYFGIVPYRGSSAPQWGQVVAAENNTTVTVFPNVALPGGNNGGTVNPAPANQQTKYTLNAGEYIQWQESMEMSGTILQSNNPIAFTGGQGYDCYTSMTSTGGGCDSAHQQVPPVSAFGSEYVGIPYATRMASLQEESIKYRIVGAVKGTTLKYTPAVAGAPTSLMGAQVVDFEAVGPFVVTSQDANHPFYLGQIMPGCNVSGGSRPPGGCLGDEEYVNILPPAQFLTKYVFFSDPTYPTTNLVFLRVKTGGSFKDVNLDCKGVLTGWKPVGANYEITNVDLIRGGMKNGTCDNGPHSASSAGTFGLMVWGLDSYSSYGYPAGGNIATINTVIVPPQNPN